MKKLFIYLMALVMSIGLTSCVSETYAQPGDEVYEYQYEPVSDHDLQLVITYGSPYIVDNVIYYYFYNGRYYYPHYYNSYFYLRVYNHPLRHYPRYWRPIPHSHWYYNGAFHRPYRSDRPHDFGRAGRGPRPDARVHEGTRGNAPHPSIGRRPMSENRQTTPSVRQGVTRQGSVQPRPSTPTTRGSMPSMRQSIPSTRGGGFSGGRASMGGTRGSAGARR